MKTMTVNQVCDFLNSDKAENFDFAIRGDNYVPARKFKESRYRGDDAPEFGIGGVSAIFIPTTSFDHIEDAIYRAKQYGKHVFLLCGQTRNAHPVFNDPQECRMSIKHKIVCEIII